MGNDSFENLNKFGRREVLTILPFTGVMGAIAFLLNACTLPAGIRKITGEVFINGRRILSDQLEGTDGILVQHDASISTGCSGSAVFVI